MVITPRVFNPYPCMSGQSVSQSVCLSHFASFLNLLLPDYVVSLCTLYVERMALGLYLLRRET